MAVLNCAGYTRILDNLKEIQTEENSAEELHLNMINALNAKWDVNAPWTANDLAVELLAEGKLRKLGPNAYTGSALNDAILSTMPEEIIRRAIEGSLSPDSVGRLALSKVVRRKISRSTIFLEHKHRTYYFKRIEEQSHL